MRTWIAVGAGLAFLAVAAGAFGAHALRSRVAPDLLAVFETGARYHMFHAIAVVLVGLVAAGKPGPLLAPAALCFVAGILLFSGSLYALALTGIRALGAITPLGGLAFLAGWALLAVAAAR
jgi:uncharacterized membrane protein YgdD (TMEM256/DUF423 family)